MIGVDTNVLVRFLTQDDPEQAERANQAFARMSTDAPGFLSELVLVETFWVLTRAYRQPAEEVLDALIAVIDSDGMQVRDVAKVRQAIHLARHGADLADALIALDCQQAGCAEVLSFDKRAGTTLGFRTP